MVRITAIRVIDRIKESGNTQKVLSRHSAVIKSRLGFHELNEDMCSREGYILLHLRDDEEAVQSLINDLDGIYGIEMRSMCLGRCDGQKAGSEAVNEAIGETANMAAKIEAAGKAGAIPEGNRVALIGMLIKNRSEIVDEVQKVLTLFGCTIRTRLGINEREHGEDTGLILLELVGENAEMNRLAGRIAGIENIYSGLITFD
ncbi:MAG: hypothetical protein U5K32_12725 [Bacteroidales bacterium]|nr:hypothetical protein [Bacteroidales bacterium]